MSNAFSNKIDTLAAAFAAAVIEAIRSASVREILESSPAAAAESRRPARPVKGAPSGRGAKPHGVAATIEVILGYVRQHPGTTGEAARKTLGIEKNHWSSAVAKALVQKKLRREGQRRSTHYWAV